MYHPGSLSPHRILRTEKNALQKRKIHAPVYTSDPYLPYHPAGALTEPEGFYKPHRDLDQSSPRSSKNPAKPYIAVSPKSTKNA